MAEDLKEFGFMSGGSLIDVGSDCRLLGNKELRKGCQLATLSIPMRAKAYLIYGPRMADLSKNL